MQHTIQPIDRAATALGTGLVVLGLVVLGIVETIAGQPYGAAPLTDEAGEVVALPLVDPNLRTALVLAGLAVLALWGLYRIVLPDVEVEPAAVPAPTAD